MIAIIKLSPVVVLAILMISGYDALIAAPLATIVAAVVAMCTEKKKFSYILDAAIANVREITIALFILMAAYAMAESFMSTGVGAAIINMALNLGITAKTVALVGAIVTAVLSIATGTSWGTFAACAPIFLWLNHISWWKLTINSRGNSRRSLFWRQYRTYLRYNNSKFRNSRCRSC